MAAHRARREVVRPGRRGLGGATSSTLLALQALQEVCGGWPVEIAVVCEGSEEQSSGGTEALLRGRPDFVRCDALVLADTGNVELGQPTLTSPSGHRKCAGDGLDHGPAGPLGHVRRRGPDALQALLMALATLRDETGETTVDGLAHDGRWAGAAYDAARFAEDAGLLEVSPADRARWLGRRPRVGEAGGDGAGGRLPAGVAGDRRRTGPPPLSSTCAPHRAWTPRRPSACSSSTCAATRRSGPTSRSGRSRWGSPSGRAPTVRPMRRWAGRWRAPSGAR